MDLFFREVGGKEREIVIIHGLYGASDNWLSIANGLKDKFKVFLPDLRNHGKSPHSDELTYELMVADIHKFIKNKTSGKVILMGHSMGGKVAMRFALEYPEMVDYLLVVDIAPRNYGPQSNFGEETNQHPEILKAMMDLDLSIAENRKDLDELWKEQFKSTQLRQFLLKNVQRGDDGKFQWQINVPVLQRELTEIMDGFSTLKETKTYKGSSVLVIRGEKSTYFLDEDTMALNTYFPGSQIVTIPNAGHWVHAEQPDLFLKTVLYFLD